MKLIEALPSALLQQLARILPATGISTAAADLLCYGYDNSRRQAAAQVVLWPTSEAETQAIVVACRAHRVALIGRASCRERV